MTGRDKIQHLLIMHLLKEGEISLYLPDGMEIQLGIIKENKEGAMEKVDDYCWLIAEQKNRTVSMDSYQFGLRFHDDTKWLCEDSTLDDDGQSVRIFTVV